MTKNPQHIPAGYKLSPLGPIPEDWEVRRLGEICTHFKSGITITSKEIKEDGLYPVYGGNGFRGYANSYTHNGNYILIGRQGALCGNINYVEGKNYISEHAIAVQTDENIQWLKYKLVNWNLNRFSESSAQPGLSVEKLVRYKLSVPTRSEQIKIAELLSLWDTAIEKQTQLVEKLTLRKRGLMQQLLTGKKRLKGFEDFKFQSMPFDRIAKTINVKPFQISKSDYHDCGSTPVVDQGQSFIAAYTDTKNAFTDTPFVLFGDHTRIVKWIDFPCVIGADGVQAIKSKVGMDIKYLYYLLSNTELPNLGYSRHMSILKEKMFYVTTNYDEQKAIVECLSNADKEIDFAKEGLLHLQKQKRGLMQVLLTGKRRVKL